MISGPLHDGPPARRGPTMIRVPSMLRWVGLLALTLAAVVSAGLFGPGQRSVGLPTSLEIVVFESSTVADTRVPGGWQEGAPRLVIENDDVEADVDDDGDTRSDALGDPPVAVRGAGFPREPTRALRGHPAIDTSRFATSAGLPRGPPV